MIDRDEVWGALVQTGDDDLARGESRTHTMSFRTALWFLWRLCRGLL